MTTTGWLPSPEQSVSTDPPRHLVMASRMAAYRLPSSRDWLGTEESGEVGERKPPESMMTIDFSPDPCALTSCESPKEGSGVEE